MSLCLPVEPQRDIFIHGLHKALRSRYLKTQPPEPFKSNMQHFGSLLALLCILAANSNATPHGVHMIAGRQGTPLDEYTQTWSNFTVGGRGCVAQSLDYLTYGLTDTVDGEQK